MRKERVLFYLGLKSLYLPGILLMAYYRLMKKVSPAHARNLRMSVPRLVGRTILLFCGIRVEIRNPERLDRMAGRPLVIFSNHNSRMDAYILLAHLPFAFKSFWSTGGHVVRENLRIVWWFGKAFDLFFFHDKADKRVTAREFIKAREYVKSGGALALFPEGGMHRDREIQMEQFGAACSSVAIDAQCEILPVVVRNTEFGFEYGKEGRKAPVILEICVPVPTLGFGKADSQRITGELRGRMEDVYRGLAVAV